LEILKITLTGWQTRLDGGGEAAGAGGMVDNLRKEQR